MVSENDNEKLEYFKEWQCVSGHYPYLLCLLLFFLNLGILVCILPFFKNTTFNIAVLGTLFLLAVIFSFRWAFKSQGNIKKVKFTPETIKIEHKTVDLAYLNRISFVKNIESSFRGKGSVVALEFSMTFLSNADVNEEVHFYMSLQKSFFNRVDRYDYEHHFIDVLQELALQRREKLGLSSK